SLFLLSESTEVKPVRTSTIMQGYLEASNVDVVHEMVEMIISYRNYEANANSLRSQDETLDKLFSRVGSR
ncbi:MAG: flagellar basal body rod C-terminal domain-containing protein, partial [candidate division Zixibacteria bacterium]